MSLRLYVWAQLLPKALCDTTNKESIEAKVWLATSILPSYLQACLALAGTSTWAGHLLGDHRQVGLHLSMSMVLTAEKQSGLGRGRVQRARSRIQSWLWADMATFICKTTLTILTLGWW